MNTHENHYDITTRTEVDGEQGRLRAAIDKTQAQLFAWRHRFAPPPEDDPSVQKEYPSGVAIHSESGSQVQVHMPTPSGRTEYYLNGPALTVQYYAANGEPIEPSHPIDVLVHHEDLARILFAHGQLELEG